MKHQTWIQEKAGAGGIGRRAVVEVALLLSVLCLWAAAAFAQTIRVEAEDYLAEGGGFHDEGGVAIGDVSCSAASPAGAGRAVEGFDYVGDWIQIRFTLATASCLIDSLRSARLQLQPPVTLAVQILSDFEEEVLSSDTLVTPVGQGIS